MENYCIDSDYYVIFTDESTAEDIADLCVHEDDLILVKNKKLRITKINLQKIPLWVKNSRRGIFLYESNRNSKKNRRIR